MSPTASWRRWACRWTCGIGNIAILSHAFAGMLEGDPRPKLQMLCHYQNIAAVAPGSRPEVGAVAARVWLDGAEVDDVYARFAAVQLTPEPVIDISGASGVTLMLAMAHGQDWSGHVPGPDGPAGRLSCRTGGRPYRSRPSRRASIARPRSPGTPGSRRRTGSWSARMAAPAIPAACTMPSRPRARTSQPDLTSRDLEQVWQAMSALRDRMLARPA